MLKCFLSGSETIYKVCCYVKLYIKYVVMLCWSSIIKLMSVAFANIKLMKLMSVAFANIKLMMSVAFANIKLMSVAYLRHCCNIKYVAWQLMLISCNARLLFVLVFISFRFLFVSVNILLIYTLKEDCSL